MSLREAAQQALEALNWYAECAMVSDKAADAASALRAALTEEALQRLTDANQEIEAVLEQESMIVDEGCFERGCACHDSRESPGVVVIKREWHGLTEEELHGLYRRAGLEAYYPRDGVVQYEYERRLDEYARAIEAALRSKNHE